MKKLMLFVSALTFQVLLTSCSQEKIETTLGETIAAEQSNLTLPASGYEMNVTEAITDLFDYDVYTAGKIEYVQDGNVLAMVDYGSGDRDELATLTANGETQQIDLAEGRDGDPERDCERDRINCFEFVFPITLILYDSSTVVINNPSDMRAVFQTCRQNQVLPRRCFDFVYPITITLQNGTTQTINNDQEMKRVFQLCHDGRGPRPHRGPRHGEIERVVVEPLVKTQDCEYIVSGIVKYFQETKWLATIDFGDGTCDDLVEKSNWKGDVEVLHISDLRK